MPRSVLCCFLLPGPLIIVMGSSLVYWGGRYESRMRFCERYNLGGATVHWLGTGGAGVDDIDRLIAGMDTKRQPAAVVTHLGGNDLGVKTTIDIAQSLNSIQNKLSELFPHSAIFFSELVYRGAYRHSSNQPAMDKARKRVNTDLHTIAPGRVITHRLLDGTPGQLRDDQVHLTDIGNYIFVNNILRWLQGHSQWTVQWGKKVSRPSMD